MYRNFGDHNFFECGLLVDTDHSDTCFNMLICRPYDDTPAYQFAHITVDITDRWINWNSVYSFCGIDDTAESVEKAIAAYEYYGPQEFGADSNYSYDWREVDAETIRKELHYYMVAWDGVILQEVW